MTTGWTSNTFGAVVLLQRGHDLPTPDRRPGKIPVVGSAGISGTHDVALYPGPGLAIGRSGASIGQATYVDEPYWPLNTCLFVRDFKGNDPRWVHNLFKLTDFFAFNSGSAQPSLNRNFLLQIPVKVPPISEQRAIAEVLGALDDKIAANARLSRSAEQLAAAVFDEAAAAAETKEVAFAELGQIRGGGTPSTKQEEYWGGEVPWATPTDITALAGPYLERTSRMITGAGLAACSSDLLPPGTILMTSRATIGAFAITQVPTAVNQGFITVTAGDPETSWWLFHDMRSRVEEFKSHANGATFLELPRGKFKALTVQMPEPAVSQRFSQIACPLHERSRAALVENARLAGVRDEFLPELMSGRLRVRDAESVVEGVA